MIQMEEKYQYKYKILHFVLNAFEAHYETLANKSNKCTTEVRRLSSVALAIFAR